MGNKIFNVYKLNENYYQFLFEYKKLNQMEQKQDRPYIGFVGIKINGMEYAIPLTSDPNNKYNSNKKYDIPIYDQNNNRLDVLKVNKMVPILNNDHFIRPIDINKSPSNFIIKMVKQLDYLNQPEIYDHVDKLANEIYERRYNATNQELAKDKDLKFAVDFKQAEGLFRSYLFELTKEKLDKILIYNVVPERFNSYNLVASWYDMRISSNDSDQKIENVEQLSKVICDIWIYNICFNTNLSEINKSLQILDKLFIDLKESITQQYYFEETLEKLNIKPDKEIINVIDNNLKYKNWNELMRDAFLEIYKNKDEFFCQEYVNLINRETNAIANNLKNEYVENIWKEWENHFFNNALLIADRIASKAKEICDIKNWDYLFKNVESLDWFSTSLDDCYKRIDNELDVANYAEIFDIEDIYNFLKTEDIEKYRLPTISEIKEMNKSLNDYRFFLVNNINEFKDLKDEFNESLIDIKNKLILNKSYYLDKAYNKLFEILNNQPESLFDELIKCEDELLDDDKFTEESSKQYEALKYIRTNCLELRTPFEFDDDCAAENEFLEKWTNILKTTGNQDKYDELIKIKEKTILENGCDLEELDKWYTQNLLLAINNDFYNQSILQKLNVQEKTIPTELYKKYNQNNPDPQTNKSKPKNHQKM